MIDPEKVRNTLEDCFFEDYELIDGKPIVEPIKVDGVINKFELHPDRVKLHESDIIKFLQELPDQFKKSPGGGGWTFLNACDTKDGTQWTGLHKDMEALFVLGMAIGKVSYCTPREMWKIFPGGMPYMVVDV